MYEDTVVDVDDTVSGDLGIVVRSGEGTQRLGTWV